MEASKGKLAERNGNGSLGNQSEAMLALNEGAQTIIQTIKQMQDILLETMPQVIGRKVVKRSTLETS